MTKFEEITAYLKEIDPAKAEYLEEEIDIIIHKLKFLTDDSFPKTIVLTQNNGFNAVQSNTLGEKIKIAGGRYIKSLDENPDCILIVQENENLYSQLSSLLEQDNIKATGAYTNNNIYIIQEPTFNVIDDEYLKDTEILAEILQPKYFVYGHDGIAWVKFDIQ